MQPQQLDIEVCYWMFNTAAGISFEEANLQCLFQEPSSVFNSV